MTLSEAQTAFVSVSALFLLSVAVMTFFWWLQEKRQNANHADVCWAFLISGYVLLFWWALEAPTLRSGLVVALVSIWSIRLGLYLFINRVLNESQEDGRYRKLREKWGAKSSIGFWFVFQLQFVLAWSFALFLLPAILNPEPFPQVFDFLAILVWLIAMAGESLADQQLKKFREDPRNRGKTCQQGLWRYSRHPNYFFEFLHWFSYVILALGSGWGVLISFGAPALMFFLLWKITGIPATEEQAKKTRPDYRDYQETTSMFIPWLKLRKKSPHD